MLAQRLPGILLPMTLAESLETTRIYSTVGQTGASRPLMATRPNLPETTVAPAEMLRQMRERR